MAVIAISADDVEYSHDCCLQTGHRLQIFSDPGAAVIQHLGLGDTDDEVEHVIARPAVFVIDAGGIVRYRYVSRSASDRPATTLLALAAESLAGTGRKEPYP